MRIPHLPILILLLLTHNIVFASNDLKGSSDHPLVSRFPGTHIVEYSKKDFNEYALASGAMQGKYDIENTIDLKRSKFLDLEGKVTRITYLIWGETSTYDIHKSMEQALKSSKYKKIFTCSKMKCGDPNAWNMKFPDIANNYKQGRRYLAYEKNGVYISHYISDMEGLTKIQLDIIEVKKFNKNKITVLTSDKLSDALTKEGKAIVSGIYFDTGKSRIKTKSAIAIQYIADLLLKKKNLKLYVVGHTDNQGNLRTNLNLSKSRANAVIQRLINKHGISKNRLKSAGIGPFSPVSSNDSEPGKSRNRRVELVKI